MIFEVYTNGGNRHVFDLDEYRLEMNKAEYTLYHISNPDERFIIRTDCIEAVEFYEAKPDEELILDENETEGE